MHFPTQQSGTLECETQTITYCSKNGHLYLHFLLLLYSHLQFEKIPPTHKQQQMWKDTLMEIAVCSIQILSVIVWLHWKKDSAWTCKNFQRSNNILAPTMLYSAPMRSTLKTFPVLAIRTFRGQSPPSLSPDTSQINRPLVPGQWSLLRWMSTGYRLQELVWTTLRYSKLSVNLFSLRFPLWSHDCM